MENNKRKKLYSISKIIVVTIFAITIFLDSLIVFEGGVYSNISEVYFNSIKIKNIVVLLLSWIITYGVITIIEKLIDKIDGKVYENNNKNKNVFYIFALVILICWMPYILTYFPGGIYSDTISTISQAMGWAEFNNHNPILYKQNHLHMKT